MKNIFEIQFSPWERICCFESEENLKIGDKVIAETEAGEELGEVVGIKKEEKDQEYKEITKKASTSDLAGLPGVKEKKRALDYCKKLVEEQGLEMKLVDVHFAFDGSRIVFAFIADGRVDFRELVKGLTRHFNKTIRMHQIGIRDEAKLKGDCGHCGRVLCCKTHLKDLVSITSEMAEAQQLAHRGSDRLSGICGRLMCCLAYEQEGYVDLADKMPPIGTKVNVDGKRGEIVGRHILKQSVDVKFRGQNGENDTVIEVDLNRHKNNKK